MKDSNKFRLVLYITGASANSIRAVNNLQVLCNKYLDDNYVLEIIDAYQHPELAEREQIIALPTLLKKEPAPERRFVGDLSDIEKILRGLGIDTK